MVTGVETAGLVLAAFPLVVKGLSNYIEGLQKIRQFQRFRQLLEVYNNTLASQYSLFQQSLVELLVAANVAEPEQLHTMLADKHGYQLWKSPEIALALKEVLHDDYDIYMQNLHQLNEDIARLKTKLKLGSTPPSHKSWHTVDALKAKMHSLIITMSKKSFDDTLHGIDVVNWVLWRFTQTAIHLESRSRKSHRRKPNFALIREQAENLGMALRVSDRYQYCECEHTASLQLQTRLETERSGNNSTERTFKLIFRRSGISTGRRTQRQRELEIVTCGFQDWPYRTHLSRPRAVRFGASNTDVLTTQPAPRVTNNRESTPIQDACAAIFDSNSGDSWRSVGYLEGRTISTETMPRHDVYLLRGTANTQSTTLETLLEDSPRRSLGLVLPWGERLAIAVTLASSILQLIETPWLPAKWKTTHITVYYQRTMDVHKAILRNIQPYVSQDLNGSLDDADGQSEPNQSGTQCEMIFAFGLTLIELLFGRSLMSMGSSSSEGETNADAKARIARQLLGEVYREAEFNYANVVEKCLRCPWQRRPDRVGIDEEFEKNVFDHIVQPLVEDLEHFQGRRSQKERMKEG